MRVVICGAGQVGYGIAERLAAEQNDVSVIDTSAQLIQAIRDSLDVRGLVGHGAHPDVLAQAGAEGADMIIAVTLYDEVNMVACQVAHSLFQVPTKIARVRAQSYRQSHWSDLFSADHMPIDVIISPEVEVGETVLRRLQLPGAIDVVRFADEKIAVIGIECDENCPVVDTPLSQLTELFPDLKAVVVGVFRNGQPFVPHSEDSLAIGDIAYVVVVQDQLQRTLGVFGHEEQEATRVVIAGGGNIGFYVARTLEARNTRTRAKMIEVVEDRARTIADQLNNTVVLNGSSLDPAILQEADIEDTDTLVALTNEDQVNLLSCVMAKRLGAQRTMTLINSPTFAGLAADLSIDAVVSPRSVTVSKVLQHVRRGRIRAVYSIQNGEAEALEAEALETSPLVGKPLRELDLPEGIRIGAIYRGDDVIIPDGSTKIAAHDRVVIFALAERVRQVEQMFRVSLEFF
jgi:trk system potassium uptake protein TrkA